MRALVVLIASMSFCWPVEASTLRVEPQSSRQPIEGFGAFGAEKVWWEQAPHFDQRFVDLIVDDLGSSLVRTQLYWDGEPENDDADPEHLVTERFRFGPSSDNGKQFAYLKALAQKGGVRILASVWTPPPWMKEGTDDSLASFCRGQCGGRLAPAYRRELAEYLVAYLREFQRQVGVELYALSIQNEPLFANPFESCVYTAAEYAATLKEIGQRLTREGLRTQLFGPEHMGDYDWNQRSGLFDAVLDDPTVATYLGAYAVHGYHDGVKAHHGDGAGWVRMGDRVRGRGKALWMTETSEPNDATWESAFRMARSLHLALESGQINAWIHWTYASRLTQGDEPLPLFHVLKHWFKYVRPGFVRVAAHTDDPRLLITAFRGPGKLVVVVVNDGQEDASAELAVPGLGPTSEMFRTVSGRPHRRESPVTDAELVFPKRSITTIVGRLEPAQPERSGAQRTELRSPSTAQARSLGCGCSTVETVGSGGLGVTVALGIWLVRSARRQRAHRGRAERDTSGSRVSEA